MRVTRKSGFLAVLGLLAGLGMFHPAAQAQSVLTDTLGLPSTGSSFVGDGLNPLLGTLSAQGNATVSSAIVALGNYSNADIAMLLADSTLLIGNGALTFSGYDEATQRASYSGSVAVNQGQQYDVTLNCMCADGRFFINYAEGTATGWPFSLGVDTAYHIQLSGTLTALPSNTPPQLDAIADRSDFEGRPISFLATARDSGDVLSWSAENLPPGFDINNLTGEISGTGTSPGTYNSMVTVSDGHGASAQQGFVWTIRANAAPVIAPINDQTTPAFSTVSLGVSASDADGDAYSFSADGLPDGLSLDAATGVISGTPAPIGVYEVTVSVSDIYAAYGTSSFTWTITEAPSPAGNTGPATPATPFSRHAPLQETSVQQELTATRLRLASSLRLALSSGTDRLTALRHQPRGTTHNRSQHRISARFSDATAQQIVDSGLTQSLNKAVSGVVSKTSDRLLPQGTAIWSSGQLSVGSLKNIGGGKLKLRARDLALGLDHRVTDKLTLGGYLQSSNNQDDRGTYDNKLTQHSFIGYASYVPHGAGFAQLAIGRGKLDIDLNRQARDTLYGGSSSGRQNHALLALGRHFDSPLGALTTTFDLELHEVTLDAYEELGEDGAYGYREQKISNHLAGLSGTWQKGWLLQGGTLNTRLTIGYQDEIGDRQTAYAFALDDTITLYHFKPEASAASPSHHALKLDVELKTPLGWHFSTQLGLDKYQAGTVSRFRLAARWQF